MPTLYTIGHSTRPLNEFIALLQATGIEHLVDIRTVPRSRTNPQFNQDALPEPLANCQISYEHLSALGGLRGKSKTIPPETNGFWKNNSFHNYADYALTETFQYGLEALIQRAQTQRCAIMCSEAVWWRCHRRIVSDYLLAREIPVLHIMGLGRTTPATLTRGAVVQADSTVHYPIPSSSDTTAGQS